MTYAPEQHLLNTFKGVSNLSYSASGLGLSVLCCNLVDCTGKLTFATCFLPGSTEWLQLSQCCSSFFTSSPLQRWNHPPTKVLTFRFIWYVCLHFACITVGMWQKFEIRFMILLTWAYCYFFSFGSDDAFFLQRFLFPVYLFEIINWKKSWV